jgi:lipoprotein-anchoring transpeptidase ErfK/SrfK
MPAKIRLVLIAGACLIGTSQIALAQSAEQQVYYVDRQSQPQPVRAAYQQPANNMGGGFIQFLFGGGEQQNASGYQQMPQQYDPRERGYQPDRAVEAARPGFDPRYEKQTVEYHSKEAPGTLVIDTPNKFLYLVQGNGQALRYGVGVGKPGFMWAGVKTISAKKEWPAWTPPPEMLQRRPDLPRHMEGGPENPLGARAMYLGSTLYRIHGSNEPWTIGTNVSSGCIRMRNEDVIDLYGRVKVGARVVVL